MDQGVAVERANTLRDRQRRHGARRHPAKVTAVGGERVGPRADELLQIVSREAAAPPVRIC